MNEEEYLPRKEEKDHSSLSSILLLSILFPVSIIFGIGQFYTFVLGLKWRPRYINMILALEMLLFSIFFLIFNPLDSIGRNFDILTTNLLDFSLWINLFLSPYLFLSFLIGIGITFFYFSKLSWNIKNKPQVLLQQDVLNGYEYEDSPFEKFKKEQLIKKIRTGQAYNSKASPFGITDEPVLYKTTKSGKTYLDYDSSIVQRYYKGEGTTGTLLTGATGSGKTMLMLQLLLNDLKNKKPTILIDFKRGSDYAYFLSKYAKELDIPFYHFIDGKPGTYSNPYSSHQASYDPLTSESISAKTDLISNLREWDTNSEVYRKRTEDIARTIFFLLDNIDKNRVSHFIRFNQGGFISFLDSLNLNNLLELLNAYNEQWLDEEAQGVNHPGYLITNKQALDNFYRDLTDNHSSKAYIEQMTGLSQTVGAFVKGSYGSWFAKSDLTPYHINLLDLALSRKPFVVLFQFNSLKEPVFSQEIGNMILQDIAQMSSEKERLNIKDEIGLYIDEFQVLKPSVVSAILAKVRSSGIYTTLSLQSLTQITVSADKNGETQTKGIMDIIKNFIILNGSGEDSAMEFSKIIGKIKKVEYNISSENNSNNIFNYYLSPLKLAGSKSRITNNLVYDYAFPPNEFMELSAPVSQNDFKATAYYITKACMEPKYAGKNMPAIARKVHVILDEELLEGAPQDFINKYNQVDNISNDYIMKESLEEKSEAVILPLNKEKEKEEEEFIPVYEELTTLPQKRTRKPLNRRVVPNENAKSKENKNTLPKFDLSDDDFEYSSKPEENLKDKAPVVKNKPKAVEIKPKPYAQQIKQKKKEKIKNEIDDIFSL